MKCGVELQRGLLTERTRELLACARAIVPGEGNEAAVERSGGAVGARNIRRNRVERRTGPDQVARLICGDRSDQPRVRRLLRGNRGRCAGQDQEDGERIRRAQRTPTEERSHGHKPVSTLDDGAPARPTGDGAARVT